MCGSAGRYRRPRSRPRERSRFQELCPFRSGRDPPSECSLALGLTMAFPRQRVYGINEHGGHAGVRRRVCGGRSEASRRQR